MRIDVFFTIPQVKEDLLKSRRSVVVIDALRATTTICHAFAAGCGRILPVPDPGKATSFVEALGRNTLLLGGEREGHRLPDFDLGNSPAEYTPEVVSGRTLVFVTSNGTQALYRLRATRQVYIGAYVNLDALVKHLQQEGEDLLICCAGSGDQFCLEDSVCAGMMVRGLMEALGEGGCELNDAARVGLILAERYGGNLLACLQESEHGTYLSSIGFDEDLALCARVSELDVVPVFTGEQITLVSGTVASPPAQIKRRRSSRKSTS